MAWPIGTSHMPEPLAPWRQSSRVAGNKTRQGRAGRMMRYFDDFELGETWPIGETYTMTKDEIVSFAAKWDPQPFHVDEAAAEKSVYGTLTACGTHIQAVVLWLASRPQQLSVSDTICSFRSFLYISWPVVLKA